MWQKQWLGSRLLVSWAGEAWGGAALEWAWNKGGKAAELGEEAVCRELGERAGRSRLALLQTDSKGWGSTEWPRGWKGESWTRHGCNGKLTAKAREQKVLWLLWGAKGPNACAHADCSSTEKRNWGAGSRCHGEQSEIWIQEADFESTILSKVMNSFHQNWPRNGHWRMNILGVYQKLKNVTLYHLNWKMLIRPNKGEGTQNLASELPWGGFELNFFFFPQLHWSIIYIQQMANIYIHPCNHYHNQTQDISITPQESLAIFCNQTPAPLPLPNNYWSAVCLINLYFLKFHINRIIQFRGQHTFL